MPEKIENTGLPTAGDHTVIDKLLDRSTGKAAMAILYEFTLSEDRDELEFDLAAKDWTQYTAVLFSYTPPKGAPAGQLVMDLGEDAYHYVPTASGLVRKEHLAVVSAAQDMNALFLRREPDKPLQATVYSGPEASISMAGPDAPSRPLRLTGPMKTGSRFAVVGVMER